MENMEIDPGPVDEDASAEFAAIERQRLRRDTEPLLLCKLITRWPLRAFLLTLFGHIVMIATTGILYMSEYHIMPLFLDDVPMRLIDEPWDARWFAWTDRTMYNGYYIRGGINAGLRSSEFWYATLDLYYEDVKINNVFTKISFLKIKQIEDSVMAEDDYVKFCKLDPNFQRCVKPQSVLRYFDGTFININPIFNDTYFSNVANVLHEAATNNETRDDFRFFLATDHSITQNGVRSKLTRSIIFFGTTHSTEYEMESEKFCGDNLEPLLENFVDASEFKFSYISRALWTYSTRTQALKDVLWAAASMGFIFLVIFLHTRSFWIACFAILSVFASFFTGNLIYNLVLRFNYIGYFHILSLFVILGIGADDIFVFYDIWRNSSCDEYLSDAHRLSDCYRRSVFSMLITSLTTAVAFLSSAISPLLGTRSFGVFSAVVVVVNYLSIILYFPTVVIMYHTYYEKAKWSCSYPCKERSDNESSDNIEDKKEHTEHVTGTDIESKESETAIFVSRLNPVFEPDVHNKPHYHLSTKFDNTTNDISIHRSTQGNGYLYKANARPGDRRHASDNHLKCPEYSHHPDRNRKILNYQNENDIAVIQTNMLAGSKSKQVTKKRNKKPVFVCFFRNYYFQFVTHKFARWLIILVFAGVVAFFIYQASKIEPDNELFNLLPDDHPIMEAYTHKLHSFSSSLGERTGLMSIHLLFGLKQNDLSTCHFSDPVCTGKQVWDPNFNPNTEEAQLALLGLCETLRTLPETEAGKLRIQKNPNTGEYNIKCFMDNLQAFLKEESRRDGANWSLPFTKERVDDFTSAKPEFFDSNVFTADFNNNLEIAISYWLTNRYTNDYTNDFHVFDQLIGEKIGLYSTPVINNTDLLYGNDLKFVAITIGTDIQAQLLGYKEGDPIMEKWEQFYNDQINKMPTELKTGFQISSHERWVWITRQRLLVDNAIYGIVIGLCLACPILIIATGNLITGFLATFSLCCTTVCVVGVIVLGGWKLGMIEAMNMCMVVGLSVDFVVHLAEGYTLSLHHDRLSRVRDMLDLMGVSVFFGACTTLGASVFMFFTVISFFSQFAIFILSTIGFSFLFSMGLFATLLGIIGPEGDTGNVIAIFKRICGEGRDKESKTTRLNND